MALFIWHRPAVRGETAASPLLAPPCRSPIAAAVASQAAARVSLACGEESVCAAGGAAGAAFVATALRRDQRSCARACNQRARSVQVARQESSDRRVDSAWPSANMVFLAVSLAVVACPVLAVIDAARGAAALNLGAVWDKALASAARGGVGGLIAGVLQVFSFMWLRTAMNYQYFCGGSLSAALGALWKEGGLPRFYQGVQLALLQAPLSRFGDTAANAGVLVLMEFYMPSAPIALKTAAASTAASLWRFFLTPLDVLKTACQVRGEDGFQVLLARVRAKGLTELYAGSLANFVGNWIGNYPYFVVFNLLAETWAVPAESVLRILRNGVMGMVSSIASDFVSNSFRVLKTIRQSSEESESYLEFARRLLRRDGLFGLLGRGLETRLLVNVLQGTFFTIIWKLVEETFGE
eukprot:TRINITY_DN63664_c0_g1_i1.p1 TRINITY_DN63664_c0_g1~~TRINITY_DN63664_c0_g1_i1.p1  ORF type:complete len:417 (-),score=83.24 TRINITY_DN63664_c0_g1_i1:28-1257(-)